MYNIHMGLLNQLLECEFNYCRLLSEIKIGDGIITCRDKTNPDYPMQNYTYLTRDLPPKDVCNIIGNEEKKSREGNSSFIHFVFDPFQPYPDCPNLFDYTYINCQLYIYDLRKFKSKENNKKIRFLEKSDHGKYTNMEKKLTRDKNNSQINRWFNINTQNKDSKVLLFDEKEEFIGRCDLFFDNNIAKLEDLEVLQDHRKKGIGKEIVKKAIYLAGIENKNFLYLLCKQELGDYYSKLGFKLYAEFHNFIKFY